MKDDIKVIKANHEDITNVIQIVDACRHAMQHEGIFQWDKIYPSRSLIEEDIREGSMYIGQDHGIALGIVSLSEKQEDAYRQVRWHGSEPALVVHRLCVNPDYQRCGIASQLMDFAENLALQRGYASIRLDAYTGNSKAVTLYERRGYRKAGQVYFPRRALPFYCFEKIFESREV